MAFTLSSFFHLLLFLFSFLHRPIFSTANLHTKKFLMRSGIAPQLAASEAISPSLNATHPTAFEDFEVAKPIMVPKTKPFTYLILQHDFAFTYGQPPALANYTPPANFAFQKFEKVVFEWKATSKGRQYDRILGVWLAGVEIFRSCTAEPIATGIVWSVEKDITRYSSLLKTNQILAVYLGNLVDTTYTGIYHVDISMRFYPAEASNGFSWTNSDDSGFESVAADLILPISRNLPLNDALWFAMQNSSDVESKEFKIPQNAYRAVLEVYVSFHQKDEFWYFNDYNEYIAANNITGAPGNGPFRQVVVSLDGYDAGSVWPFTVIYTGGIDPLLWRPITGIGSFDLPSYDIEMTPFLGKILDGKTHTLGFSVTNALNVWYIDANLHLWLDGKSEKTVGNLIEYDASPLILSSALNFTGLDGTFLTSANRTIKSSGWVNSSHGTIITKSTQEFHYMNLMVYEDGANSQIVNQTIDFNDKVSVGMPSSTAKSFESLKNFPIYLQFYVVDRGNETYLDVSNVTLGFNEKKEGKPDQGLWTSSSLENLQEGVGTRLVEGKVVRGGSWSTNQTYRYNNSDKYCYFRNISSTNTVIRYDEISDSCSDSHEKLH